MESHEFSAGPVLKFIQVLLDRVSSTYCVKHLPNITAVSKLVEGVVSIIV